MARLVGEQFPEWSSLPVRAVEPGGWDNRMFRIGEQLVARLPSGEDYADQVAVEQEWLAVLGRHLPVTVPEVVGRGTPGAGALVPW